jgi:hypothetical protein
MWPFKGKKDDSDYESDFDSNEYETDDEELDSEEEAVEEEEASKVKEEEEEDDAMPERKGTGTDAEEEETPLDSVESEDNTEKHEEKEEEELEESHEEKPEQNREHHDEELEEQEVVQDAEHLNGATEEQGDTQQETDNEEEEEEESEEEEDATSLAEKQSLLALAAEHDRVDILKAILSSPEDHDTLLHSNDPPLHIAISFGSTNATSCLLRMGANPAIRPSNPKHNGFSAWDLAFGDKPVVMAPSKREGIRHAFTAEALRCIGSDEAERLKHLLDSGMPPSIDIGGKTLHGWCVEMNATSCEELTRPFQPEIEKSTAETEQSLPTPDQKPSAVISYPDSDSLLCLDNRLEELESLSKALSSCLDNLAEEVSVCHGLLLLGGGASALASHVRSLKMLKERRQDELEQCTMEWNDSQDELAYWLQESGGDDFDVVDLETNERKRSITTPESPQDEQAQKMQLKAQIAAMEQKVRKLRASITDLSEESARDLVEVERRGLSGGVKLVRTLREELREVEFELSEAKSDTAACRARVNLIIGRLEAEQKKTAPQPNGTARSVTSFENGDAALCEGPESVTRSALFDCDDENEASASDRIATGDSEAIAVR